MTRKCSVPECRSNYNGTNERVSTFKFPSDPLLSEKWVKNINRKDFVLRKYSNVCIKHFVEEFIVREDKDVRDDGTLLVVHRKFPTLKKEAYPTIFQNQPSYLSKKLSTKRNTPEKRETEFSACDKQFEQREKNDVITNFGKAKDSPTKRPHLKRTAVPSLNLPTDNEQSISKIRKSTDQRHGLCRCVICGKKQSNAPLRRLFAFPKDPVLCKKWVTESNKRFLKSKTVRELNARYKVCSDHFEESDYASGMLYLKSQAYPKISSCNDKSSKGIEDKLPEQEIDKKSAQSASSSENSEVKKKISARNSCATAELAFDFLSPRFKEWYQKVKTEGNVSIQSKEELIPKFSKQNCAHQDLFINENESDGPKIASITSLVTQDVTEPYSSHECLGNAKRETEIGIEMQQNKFFADTRTLCEQIMENNDSESRLLSLTQDDQVNFHNQSVVDKTQPVSLMEENILFEKLHDSIIEDESKTECSQNAMGSEIKFSGHEHRRLEIQKNAFANCKILNQNSLPNFEKDIRQENSNFHPIDTFFLLMASTVKKFNLADQHFVKTQVFSLVNGIEERYIQQNKKFD